MRAAKNANSPQSIPIAFLLRVKPSYPAGLETIVAFRLAASSKTIPNGEAPDRPHVQSVEMVVRLKVAREIGLAIAELFSDMMS